MDRITSSKNPKIQQVRALINQHKERQQSSRFVIEGVRLTEEALASGWLPELAFISPSLSERGIKLARMLREKNVEMDEVDDRLLTLLSDTKTPQGILAVLQHRDLPMPEEWDFLLVLDGLRDPGNLGTILRSAAAAGVQACLLTPGTTDPFAPKVVRSGMGAHFRLPIRTTGWDEIKRIAKSHSADILIADSARGQVCWEADLCRALILTIGGEAEGVQPAAYEAADGLIHIPMPGRGESLNASTAASILLFEVVRQRSK